MSASCILGRVTSVYANCGKQYEVEPEEGCTDLRAPMTKTALSLGGKIRIFENVRRRVRTYADSLILVTGAEETT